jgi:D-alanyl-lipoteichoic acid acyltransferase DltB (MBOAT superfamily)
VEGYFKKLVVADNLAGYVDRVFMLEQPSLGVLAAGSLAFTIQIYADFSAYSDIARGSARLLGLELMVNFHRPYWSLTLGDFWRRWHISLSTWIRDYVYIPLGGSRVSSRARFALGMLLTMGLSGLWHGADWHFVIWGLYHGVGLLVYRRLGFERGWTPRSRVAACLAWAITFGIVAFGLAIFRARSVSWLVQSVFRGDLGLAGDDRIAGAVLVGLLGMYCLPWLVLSVLERFLPQASRVHNLWRWVMIGVLVLLAREGSRDFIYFQF